MEYGILAKLKHCSQVWKRNSCFRCNVRNFALNSLQCRPFLVSIIHYIIFSAIHHINMLDALISKVNKYSLHVMFDRVMKYPLHHRPCLYTSSVYRYVLFQD